MQEPADTARSFLEDLQSGKLTYAEAKRRYNQLGEAIRHRYEKQVTAVSVDVVGSTRAKGTGSDLEAQTTFDEYHRLVEQQLLDHGCRDDYTWAGDGLLAIFEQPEAAVWFGRSLLEGMQRLNRISRLQQPLHVRIGIHSGPVIREDNVEVGKIASSTFDFAGHLQKAAQPDQMLVSEQTYAFLREAEWQFVEVHRDVLTAGPCYAYPPHTVTGAFSLSAVAPPPTPPAPAEPSPLPWIGAGVALGIIALGTVAFVMWPRQNANAGRATGMEPPPVAIRQDLGPREPSPSSSNTPPQQPTAHPAGDPYRLQRTETPRRPDRAPATAPPEPAPSTLVWRSPDAASGLPARLVPSPPELRWALCISSAGADRPPGGPYPSGAETAARLLRQHAAVPVAHFRVLTGPQATQAGIRQAFLWLQQNAASGKDTVFVYLGGMAVTAPDRPDIRHPGGSGYAFVPYDGSPANAATLIYGAEIAAWFGAARSQTTVVLLDTGFGSTLDLPPSADPGRQLAVISATNASQRGVPAPGSQAGAFVEALAAGLKGDADANHNGKVSLLELAQFLRGDVPRRTNNAATPDARTGFGGGVPELEFSPGG